MAPRLCVEERGAGGRPLLLLHGIGGGKSSWTPVVSILAGHRRTLTPDLLGFGRSPWPDIGYTVDDHLVALEQLLRDRGLATGQIDVAGHSMGAILAAAFAARHAGRVERLTMVCLPYFRSESEARHWIASIGLLARLTVLGHWAAGTICGVMCALRPTLTFLAPHFAPHVPAAVARDALMHNYASYSRTLQNVIVRHRLDPALDRLADRPVRLVHGDRDRSAPLDNVRPLVERYPCWRLQVVAGADHHLPLEQPERLAELLR